MFTPALSDFDWEIGDYCKISPGIGYFKNARGCFFQITGFEAGFDSRDVVVLTLVHGTPGVTSIIRAGKQPYTGEIRWLGIPLIDPDRQKVYIIEIDALSPLESLALTVDQKGIE